MRIPEAHSYSLAHRLERRRAERWPDLPSLSVRYRGGFAYVAGLDAQGEVLPLFRLRYLGSLDSWGFAIYLGSKDGYEDSSLPSSGPTGTPEEALDCACGLYLNDPSAWPNGPMIHARA